MEMLSVSLIVPFMNAVMNPDEIMGNKYVSLVCELLDINSYRTFLVFLALVMAIIYVIKNVFLMFQMTIQNRFVYNNMFLTQERLLDYYLMRPYDFFLDVKSGEVLRIVGSDTSEAFTVLTTLLQLISELIVSGILIITVFFMAPVVTFGMAALLSLMLLVITKLIRPLLARAGVKHRDAYAAMNQWLLQTIQGIKEVKILKKENFFKRNYSISGRLYVKTLYQNQTLAVFPRFMIEAISLASFFVVIACMIYNGIGLEAIIPTLSAVALAAIRILPSVNRISQSTASIAFNYSALDKMIENINAIEGNNNTELKNKKDYVQRKPIKKFEQNIQMDNVTYRYPHGNKNILCNASVTIKKGETVGIVGTSGSGKTTMIDILLGLLTPNYGDVLIDSVNIKEDMDGWLEQLAYVPQSIFMLDGSVRENVAFGINSNQIDDEKVWEALREASLDDVVRELPEKLDAQLGERGVRFSGGQRQRIGIARALYTNPSVIVFDEATSALDSVTEEEIMKSINRLRGSKTIIIIAHRISTIENCDSIYRVENGKILKER